MGSAFGGAFASGALRGRRLGRRRWHASTKPVVVRLVHQTHEFFAIAWRDTFVREQADDVLYRLGHRRALRGTIPFIRRHETDANGRLSRIKPKGQDTPSERVYRADAFVVLPPVHRGLAQVGLSHELLLSPTLREAGTANPGAEADTLDLAYVSHATTVGEGALAVMCQR